MRYCKGEAQKQNKKKSPTPPLRAIASTVRIKRQQRIQEKRLIKYAGWC